MSRLREILGGPRRCAIVLLASCVVLLVGSAAYVACDLMAFRAALVRDLSVVAEITGQSSTAALAFRDPRAAQESLAPLSANPRIVSAVIFEASGEAMAVYPRGRTATGVAWPASGPDGERFEKGHLLLCRGIALENDHLGRVCIQSSTQELQARLRRFITLVGVVLALCALLARMASSAAPAAVTSPGAAGPAAAAGEAGGPAHPSADRGEDLELLIELARVFTDEGPLMLEEIRQAVEGGDVPAIARAAHKIKGALGALGQRARPAAEAARRVESLARGGDLAQAQQAWPALKRDVDRLMPELSALAGAPAPPSR
jgi:HPt (histidine-containing phosphotransfer) domain-containing protein